MQERHPASRNKGILKRLRTALAGLTQCKNINLREAYHLEDAKVRIPFEGFPIQIILGDDGKTLHVYPEFSREHEDGDSAPDSFLIIDPEKFFSELSGFVRLKQHGKLTLGCDYPEQVVMFGYPATVANRHLTLECDGDAIVFKAHAGAKTCVSPVMNPQRPERLQHLREIRGIYGGRIEPLPKKEAMATLEEVNALMLREAFRPVDSDGMPGGLIDLPADIEPIIVGDLHAQVDNLLSVLSQGGALDGLASGANCLIILGDSVHSEVEGHMDEMESSMLMMDLIFRLKLRFPDRVFYIRGNHDSFSDEIAKQGIPQGLVWAKALRDARGKRYRKAMQRFYDLLPYVVVSKKFLACHAAAPKTKVTREMLVELRRYPGLQVELISNRLQRPNRPAGYTKGDIKRLRKAFALAPDVPFIVGHTPMDATNTLWMDVMGIKHHHVLYSAQDDCVGSFVGIKGGLVPLQFRSEALTSLINQLEDEAVVALAQGE